MPGPLAARGIIFTVCILAGASLAVYENEKCRAWLDRLRQRIAIGLHSLGDEIDPRARASNRKDELDDVPLREQRNNGPRKTQKSDASMNEDQSDAAEERRRQARAHILERGRILEERRKRRRLSPSSPSSPSSPTFDSMVDDDGRLRVESAAQDVAVIQATATAIEPAQRVGTVRSRHTIPTEADAAMSVTAGENFETAYEREMRTSWNLPLPAPRSFDDASSTHASQSLLDLTPTTEDFADPDYSVPSRPTGQSDYFSATQAASPPEYYYAHPSRPLEAIEPGQQRSAAPGSTTISSAPSIAGSTDLLHPSEADISEDDLLSEDGLSSVPDGIRTPASAWTDVESTATHYFPRHAVDILQEFAFWSFAILLVVPWFICVLRLLFVPLGRKKLVTWELTEQNSPKVVVVMPVYREPPDSLWRGLNSVVESDYPAARIHVFVSFDGEDIDELYLKTVDRLGIPVTLKDLPKSISVIFKGVQVTVSRFPHGGKRRCQKATYMLIDKIYKPYLREHDDLFILFIDSDCILDPVCIQNFMWDMQLKPKSKHNMLAMTGIITACTHKHSLLTLLQDMEYVHGQLYERSVESGCGAVTCLPGALTILRYSAFRNMAKFYFSDKAELCNDMFDYGKTYLGEDRWLTHLFMLGATERYQISMSTSAFCKTEAVRSFRTLLKQRRRWFLGFITNEFIIASLAANWLMMICFAIRLHRYKAALYPLMFILNPFMNWIYMVYGIFTAGQRTWGGPRADAATADAKTSPREAIEHAVATGDDLNIIPETFGPALQNRQRRLRNTTLQPSPSVEGRFVAAVQSPSGFYGRPSGMEDDARHLSHADSADFSDSDISIHTPRQMGFPSPLAQVSRLALDEAADALHLPEPVADPGIDFGAQSTKIGVARNKGIDIITNETSNRSTPSLVGFGPKSRYLGEAAKTQEISNLKNTIGSLKRLAGRSINDPEVAIEQEFITAPLVDINGVVGAEVTYRGERQKFTAVQLIAMYLGKIRDTAAKELKLPVSDVVISVPPWFTDGQRRAILDAADIASLKTLRLINDSTAIALGYGITKTDLPEGDAKPRRVVFVDIGYSDYVATVVEYRKGELTVKATAFDRHFGGRDFDKALTRVATAVEKLKKILSANAQAPISIESLMDDKDVRGMLKREELEQLVKPLLDRVTVPLEQALAEAKLGVEDIDAIEMVGGCTRVPAIKEAISSFFRKPLSFTLNQDEAVARGCAFSCAILSPVFRVRDFSIHDIVTFPIEFTWEQSPDIPDEDTTLTVFNRGNVMPSTKILTFYRKEPFDLEARYSKPEALPGKVNPWIGRFSVKGVKADPNDKDDFMICKLKARLNLHGILNVESGYYVEDVEVEEPITDDKKGDADADQANGSAESRPTRKVRKQVRKGDLPLSSATASLDASQKQAAAEQENAMFMEDKLVTDTEDKKNELESYIYELRNKLEEQYAEFASEEEKEKIRDKLTQSEDWLYDEGDDATKAQYVAKLDEINFVAGPVIQRYNDKIEEERQAALKAQEAAAAKKRAEEEARKKAEEAAKQPVDTEMKDAEPVETVKADGVEEAA
ncbi:hypothetical protein DV738_g3087, partial [Chaetothyriales sp. CBS 135597]